MNIRKSIKIGLAFIFLSLLIIGIFFQNNPDIPEKQEIENNKEVQGYNSKVKDSSDFIDSDTSQQTSKTQRIKELQAKASSLYESTFANGDISKKKQYNYEDDWCIAKEDLKEKEFNYFQNEVKEWLLERGHVSLQDASQEFLLNNEFIESYQELELETLLQLSKNDDQMALITLLNRPNINSATRDNAARRLVVLGDTSTGLSRLVMNELNKASFNFKPDSEDSSKSKQHLIKVMALVEYGLMRSDTSALFTFLMYAEDHQTFLSGMDPGKVLKNTDFLEISKKAKAYYDGFNNMRLSESLPPFGLDDESKATKMYYKEMLAKAFIKHGRVLNASWWSTDWKQEYLEKSSCVSRMIARDKFVNEQLPAIRKEIAKLQ